MTDPQTRSTQTPTKRRWYRYVLITIAVVVGGFFALMIAMVVFFMLIAGW